MAHGTPAPYLFPVGAHLGADNVVLHARSRRHQVEGYAGPVSVKTVVAGQVDWIVGGRKLVVDQSSFLILAAGERYSMNIAEAEPVETCCVFFAPNFVEGAARDATLPLEQALDMPERPPLPLPYLSALHSDREHALVRRVHSLAPRCEGLLTPSSFEEDFLLLAEALLQCYQQIREEAGRIPAIRESTRQELFRRLLVGREFMHSHSSGAVSLAAVAQAACLSTFHFHRGFARAFRQTPHGYLTELRLAQARKKIESGSLVLDACLEVGFTSPSAFSRLFRSQFGESPGTVRRKLARSGKKHSGASGTMFA